ncbi:MAG: WYL domain-containing transcriptional regulator [Arcobacteraceae bacterium]|jgi:predicted DNA-binding transcriptional regulator YafY|nr:WYL domain-containing transcriptional regulator [Arcobacteraceae bacterium]
MKKSLYILVILKELIQKGEVNIQRLAMRFEVHERTIQRYIEDLKEVFDDNIKKIGKNYHFIDTNFLSRSMLDFNKDELEKFIDLALMIDGKFIEKLDSKTAKYFKQLQKDFSKYYLIKPIYSEKPYQNEEVLRKVKQAIKYKQYSTIMYNSNQKEQIPNAKIIKILYMEGNYYVATLTDDYRNNGFKLLRLSFIENIKLDSKTYHTEVEASEYIKNIQTLFSQYKKEPYEVVLQIDSSIKKHFKQKKFLPSQKIVSLDKTSKDDLIISYKVTSDMEILPLIKKWMPLIKIVSPQILKDRYKQDLKEALSDYL